MTDWTAITAVISSITAVGGTLGGFWFSGRNDEARDKRTDQRETRARRMALTERLEEERHVFQRDTLLELQDVLLQLSRYRALITAQDMKTLKEQRKMFLLPDGLGGDDHRLTAASAQKLRSRVLDSDLRAAIGDFIALCARDSFDFKDMDPDKTIEELLRRDMKVTVAYTELAERIGEHLRAELDRRILAGEIEQA